MGGSVEPGFGRIGRIGKDWKDWRIMDWVTIHRMLEERLRIGEMEQVGSFKSKNGKFLMVLSCIGEKQMDGDFILEERGILTELAGIVAVALPPFVAEVPLRH